jgi:hypothetical protein
LSKKIVDVVVKMYVLRMARIVTVMQLSAVDVILIQLFYLNAVPDPAFYLDAAPVLRILIVDPMIFFIPGIRSRIWDEHSRSFFRELRTDYRAKNI